MSITRVLAAGSILAALSLPGCSSTTPPCVHDALTARTLAQLHTFTHWLHRFRAHGVIGEVGWPAGPDSRSWNALASTWYRAASDAAVSTFAWSGAEQWPPQYPLAIYRSRQPGRLDLAGPQAAVLQAQPTAQRGLALADGSFGATPGQGSSYSNQNPGTAGADYRYPSTADLGYLRQRGIRTVRVAFTWERLQPQPSKPLSPIELGRLRQVLAAAATTGLHVILDLHNYGRYAQGGVNSSPQTLTVGSPELPASALADLWRRLASAVHSSPALAGYGLMNEPHDLPGGAAGWEAASQGAVDALRGTDTTTPVYVAGYGYSSAAHWSTEHPRPWISHATMPILYEAHQYFDDDNSGSYHTRYGYENTTAQREGWARCGTP